MYIYIYLLNNADGYIRLKQHGLGVKQVESIYGVYMRILAVSKESSERSNTRVNKTRVYLREPPGCVPRSDGNS